MKAYGPVPSRRLGKSLGVNNIPPKICTYSCVYCQLGKTIKTHADRRIFYKTEDLIKDVEIKINEAEINKETIDYISLVPDGEPTLDLNLGKEIKALKQFGIKTAVITNASLIWRKDVRKDLQEADWISLKIDALTEETWREIDRPHPTLNHQEILDGMLKFAQTFKGELTTETMLIHGINDNTREMKKIAEFLSRLKPDTAYLAIPTRPPANKEIKPATEERINLAYQIFSEKLPRVEYLIGYEGNAFASSGDVVEDLLSITSVHPMREDAVRELLSKTETGWEVVDKLIRDKRMLELEYLGDKFYMRRLPGRQ